MSARTSAVLLITVVALTAIGCGKSGGVQNTDPTRDELVDMYEMYTEYLKNHQKAPKQVADFKSYEPIHTLACRVLKEGKYVMVWGLTSKDSGTVLAYPKDAPAQGGSVLMADGTIKTMSADELKSHIKG